MVLLGRSNRPPPPPPPPQPARIWRMRLPAVLVPGLMPPVVRPNPPGPPPGPPGRLAFSVLSIPVAKPMSAASMPCSFRRRRASSLSPAFMPNSLLMVATRCDPSLLVTKTRRLAVLAAAPEPPDMRQALRIINSK